MDQNDNRINTLFQTVKLFPRLPGVYLMRDKEKNIIYIGKAKSLRERVKTYFTGGDGRIQIEYLMKKVHQIDHVVTESDYQAII